MCPPTKGHVECWYSVACHCTMHTLPSIKLDPNFTKMQLLRNFEQNRPTKTSELLHGNQLSNQNMAISLNTCGTCPPSNLTRVSLKCISWQINRNIANNYSGYCKETHGPRTQMRFPNWKLVFSKFKNLLKYVIFTKFGDEGLRVG